MESYLTRRLLDEQTDPNLHPFLIKTLCALAGDADTERITDFLCAQPESNLAIDVLLRHGCPKQAERLWKVWQRSGVPEGGFSLLGRFAVQEAAPAAWEAVRSGDWFVARDGVMGLLGLDLSELRREIIARLDLEEGRNLFTEMLPALAVRAGWPNVLPRLRFWCDQASTDCLGGLILGLALVGGEAKELFQAMLNQERYELDETGTGNLYWSWLAGRLLDLDLPWLSNQLRSGLTSATLQRLFLGWLRCRLDWQADSLGQIPPPTPWEKLYLEAFSWGSDPDHNGSLESYFLPELQSEFSRCENLVSVSLSLEWSCSNHRV